MARKFQALMSSLLKQNNPQDESESSRNESESSRNSLETSSNIEKLEPDEKRQATDFNVTTSASNIPRDSVDSDSASCVADISRSPSDGPVQPKLEEYPQINKRRFNSGYFSQFPWIEYSVSQDAVFCYSCRHFSSNVVRPGEKHGNVAFVDKGFKKWKDAKELLFQHASSAKHKDSTVVWADTKRVASGETECVANQLITQRKLEVVENRNHLKYLIAASSYLARQGLAFRGDDESDISSNKGNYIELLEVMSEFCPQLCDRMQARYGHYTSAEYQNDILHCLAKVVRNSVIESCGPYWALMVDESKDVSRKEQSSFVI